MLLCAVSCQKESGLGKTGKGREIKVKLGMDQITKSGEDPAEEFLFAVPFVTDSGQELSLEAFISDIPEGFQGYATKGAPVTTDNLASLYGSFKTTVYKGDDVYTDPMSQKTMSNIEVIGDEYGYWFLDEGPYYWPEEEDEELIFCSSAPISAASVSNIAWDNGTELTFDYTNTPGGTGNDAKAQKDLIFGINANSRTSHTDGHEVFAWINFSHALTAVKFIRGEIENCTINTVTMKNFYGAGSASAVINTTAGDDRGLKFTWTPSGALKTYVQTFGNEIGEAGESGAVALNGTLDPSDDESCTFMMIPQELPATATIEISLTVGSTTRTVSLNLGSITEEQAGSAANAAKLKDWSTYAGKVITMKVNTSSIASVSIEDQVDVNTGVKSNLVITNTGTVQEYIRASIQGNWFTNNGMIVAPWYYDTADPTAYGFDDTLPTGETGSGDRWIYKDGFYYYTGAVSPGQATGTQLFQTFTAGSAPAFGCHLELAIMAQAVKYVAGEDCWEAFTEEN